MACQDAVACGAEIIQLERALDKLVRAATAHLYRYEPFSREKLADAIDDAREYLREDANAA